MISLCRGRYRIRTARTSQDVAAAQELRHLAFHGVAGRDSDSFDALCHHVLIEEMCTGRLVGCFRFLPLRDGSEIACSYAAQCYDLSRLALYPGAMVEMGRFCVHPDLGDPDILRIAWGAMATYVDAAGVGLLFGCASFPGTDPQIYLESFSLLKARHLAPLRWSPRVKAPDVFRFARPLSGGAGTRNVECAQGMPEPRSVVHRDAAPATRPNFRKALADMPPLLRTYLGMGGWVSDHAVVDAGMNTLHVFTGIEVDAIPPARKRLLRAVAG